LEIRWRAKRISQIITARAAKAKLAKLQGVWKPVSAEYEGKGLDPKEDDWTLKFTGDAVVHLKKGQVYVEGKLEIASPAESFERAYWKYTNVNVTDSVIFRFDGHDTLVTCWNGRQGQIAEWPSSFTTGPLGTGIYLVVWNRER
jgi:uncharacterized protein (TIGR03067 family)